MFKAVIKNLLLYFLIFVTAFSLLTGCNDKLGGATDESTSNIETSQTNNDPQASESSSCTEQNSTEVEASDGETSEQEIKTEFDYDDPNFDASHFYDNYYPATSYEEATKRSDLGLMSGSLETPDQKPIELDNKPMQDGLFIRNNEPIYLDENTYVLVDMRGIEVMRIYRGGAYITLEEVAAYLYAFGEIPANYSTSKKTDPEDSIWGEYLRVNHSKFKGDTTRYPYEPKLPYIDGCGGELCYYEIDIGTTGTDCDPKYTAKIYNDGVSITRGAARIVYTRCDIDQNDIIDPNEKFLFYTYNHYNDFQEYLNYYGGWGEMFGNITGGGTLSSKSDFNPTPYVPVIMASLKGQESLSDDVMIIVYAWIDRRAFEIFKCA